MTTPSTVRKAGPFTGNGSQTAWPFTFKVFAAADIKVTIANAAGTETVLTLGTDYTVSLNANQDTSPGGSVTYLLANNSKLTITGDLDYDQSYDIPSGGNFNPVALENQLDRMVMQTQQLAEQMARAVKVPVTDDGTGELSGDLAQGILALGPIAGEIDTVAGISSSVVDAASNASNINAVAGISGNVTTVAGISANVTAVANNATNVNAVAAKTTQITQVAAIDDEVAVVAGIAANVTTVAGIASSIPTVATNVADIQNFADVYQGAKASAPTLRNDGTALQVGDLYFSTAANAMQAYGSTGWVAAGTATPVTITPQAFNGDGTTTAFTLSTAPAFPAALDVFISGVHQALTTNYTVSGTALTFVTAPPAGTGNIRVKILSAYAGGVPNNGSVTPEKLADGAVTAEKIATGAVTAEKIATGAVGATALATDSVTADKIAAGAVGTSEIADGAVGTAELAADAVTADKIADAAVTTAKIADANVTTAKIASSAIITSKIADAQVTDAKIAAVSAPKITGDIAAARITNALNASGSAPIYAARAWVNFNGTGTVAIRASGNVSSITDNGVGDYTVNFTTAMPDANYARCVTAGGNGTTIATNVQAPYNSVPTTTALRFGTFNTSWTAPQDGNELNISIFR